jgi:hypothetical protein
MYEQLKSRSIEGNTLRSERRELAIDVVRIESNILSGFVIRKDMKYLIRRK